MAIYNSLPILDALISDVQRDPFCQSSLKAMVSGTLNYYFPVTDNFAVCYKEAQRGFLPTFLSDGSIAIIQANNCSSII